MEARKFKESKLNILFKNICKLESYEVKKGMTITKSRIVITVGKWKAI